MSSGRLPATRVPSRKEPAASAPGERAAVRAGQRERDGEQVRQAADPGLRVVVLIGTAGHDMAAGAGDQLRGAQPRGQVGVGLDAEHPGRAVQHGRVGGREAGPLGARHRVTTDEAVRDAGGPGRREHRRLDRADVRQHRAVGAGQCGEDGGERAQRRGQHRDVGAGRGVLRRRRRPPARPPWRSSRVAGSASQPATSWAWASRRATDPPIIPRPITATRTRPSSRVRAGREVRARPERG